MKITTAKTFKSRCKLFSNLSKDDISKIKVPKGYSFCASFNHNTNLSDNTKIVIVGTLTPKRGREIGFYYSSPTNHMLDILDTYFLEKHINTNLKTIKNKLIKNPKSGEIIEELKSELNRLNIALLDVVDTSIASDLVASDDEILYFNLDYATFSNISNTNLIFICNSRNAEYAFKIIAKNINKNFTIDFAPQIWRKSKQAIQHRWNIVLDKYLG